MQSLRSTETALPYVVVSCLLFVLLKYLQPARNKAPIANPKKWFEWSENRVAKEFAFGSQEILSTAAAASGGKPFQVYSTQGLMTVLDSKYITEIKNDVRFSFEEHVHRAFNGDLPGFEAFDNKVGTSWFLVQIAQKHLTAYLNQMTKPLSDQCNEAVAETLTDRSDWNTVNPNFVIAQIVSKMSTRIFLGQEFCDDNTWIDASRNYATNAFSAQERLSLWSPYLRRIIHWFLPYCRQLRKDVAQCRSIINNKIAKRTADRASLEKQGKEPDQIQDSLEWMGKVAKGKGFDATKLQLSLTMAAIHTTTDLITWLLMCIADKPETVKALRDEMISVLKVSGWKKTSLYNLKLLDSAMKESQRIKPNLAATMRRRAMADITLSDGTFIPRNTMLLVYSSKQMRDPKLYKNPEEFQADRFYDMRKVAGKENQAQFVTTSPEHMGFSHGQHSCPGRFFASNETKILLCHLLLKYEIRVTEGSPRDSVAFGFALIPNPAARLDIRRRKEEIDLVGLPS
ncbi:trichothecene C-8 hydroxylase [Pyrenochaeta sp. DS3sAY3a]|nr:trichothecene C-8 hydroxylase [Pyrenochaeta sp. DS3sAY3a]